MEKNKIIIVDLIGTLGHIAWLNKLLSIIEKDFEIIFISYESYCKKIILDSYIIIDDKYLNHSNKYSLLFNQIRTIRKIKNILKQFDLKIPIYIVGFENISYGLFGFSKRKVLLHFHNNLDGSILSRFFLKIINKDAVFIVYEKYIQDYLKRYKNTSYTLSHTLNFNSIDENLSFKNYIFIPSKVDSLQLIDSLLSFAILNNLKIILRSEKALSTDVIIAKPYFENYEELFRLAKYVGIYAPHNYRISGVFYEAMLFNKQIIPFGNEGVFICEKKKEYPFSFIDINDKEKKWLSKDIQEKKYQEHEMFIDKHNDLNIEEQFHEIIKN